MKAIQTLRNLRRFAGSLTLLVLLFLMPLAANADDYTITNGGATNSYLWPASGTISLAAGDVMTILPTASSPTIPTTINIAADANVTIKGNPGVTYTNLRIADATDAVAHTVAIDNLQITAPSGTVGYAQSMGALDLTGANAITSGTYGIQSTGMGGILTIGSSSGGTLTVQGGTSSGIDEVVLNIRNTAKVTATTTAGPAAVVLSTATSSITVEANASLTASGGTNRAIYAISLVTALSITCDGTITATGHNGVDASSANVTVTGGGTLTATSTGAMSPGIYANAFSVTGTTVSATGPNRGLIVLAAGDVTVAGNAKLNLADTAGNTAFVNAAGASYGFSVSPGSQVTLANNGPAPEQHPFTQSPTGNMWALTGSAAKTNATDLLTASPLSITIPATSSGTIKLTPATDTTAPVLSAGTVNRTSDTTANIGFTTDEAGTAYYVTVVSGGAAPTAAAVAAGPSLGAVTAAAVTVTALTLAAGAQDIYVVVKDAAGNISTPLKISAPAYAPDYTINGTGHMWAETAAIQLAASDVMTILSTVSPTADVVINVNGTDAVINGISGTTYSNLRIKTTVTVANLTLNNLSITSGVDPTVYMTVSGADKITMTGSCSIENTAGTGIKKTTGDLTIDCSGTTAVKGAGTGIQTSSGGNLILNGAGAITATGGWGIECDGSLTVNNANTTALTNGNSYMTGGIEFTGSAPVLSGTGKLTAGVDASSTDGCGITLSAASSLTITGPTDLTITGKGTGTGIYAAANPTITFNRAVATTVAGGAVGIRHQGTGTLTLENAGSGAVTIQGGSTDSYGIYSAGNLNITGSGTGVINITGSGSDYGLLLTNSSAATATFNRAVATSISSTGGMGLYCSGALTLTNSGTGAVYIIGGPSPGSGHSIYSALSMTVNGTGTIGAAGGAGSYGVYVGTGTLTVDDATLNVAGGSSTTAINPNPGILIGTGTLTLKNNSTLPEAHNFSWLSGTTPWSLTNATGSAALTVTPQTITVAAGVMGTVTRAAAPGLSVNIPADITVNGVTAHVTISGATHANGSLVAGELITVHTTYTGTASVTGMFTLGVSSATAGTITAAGGLLNPRTSGLYQGYSGNMLDEDFTFTMPATNITDLALTHTLFAASAVTSVTANPVTIASTGGASTITVNGSTLVWPLVTAFDGLTATTISGTTTGTITSQTVSLTFPANTSTTADKVYTIKVSLDGGTTWVTQTATVTVSKATAAPAPAVSGITAGTATIASAGGTSTFTISGSNLTGATITAFDGATPTAITGTTTGSATSQTATLTFPANTSTTADKVYTVKISFDGGVTWETQTVTVTVSRTTASPPVTVNAAMPYITYQPQDETVEVGDAVTLSVTATVSDGGALSYRWYDAATGRPISGATGRTYSPPTATPGTYTYYVVVTNTNNSVNGSKIATATSNTVTVTVNPPAYAATPVISVQLKDSTVNRGATLTLSVTATVSDGGTLTYQWYDAVTGKPISGATGSSYSPPTTTAGTYSYYVVITNTNSSATVSKTSTVKSRTVTITVNSPTDIENVSAFSSLRAWALNGTLHVSGLTAGKPWSVYSITGYLIYQGIATGDTETLYIASHGVYIVQSGNKTVKVVN